jgi:hypothetical protein
MTPEKFIEEYLSLINGFRTNPASYVDKIKEHIAFIQPNADQKTKEKCPFVYNNPGFAKVALIQGEQAFRNTINTIQNMKPLLPVDFKQELQLPFGPDPKKWSDNKAWQEVVNAQKQQFGNSFTDLKFHYDTGIAIPEVSFILQLVDDSPFKGKRTANIMNPNTKYIGINFIKEEKNTCSTYLFASS